RGLTILLIEHVMRAVMALAARVLVMHHGAAIAEGAPDQVVRDRAVIESYLGAETVGCSPRKISMSFTAMRRHLTAYHARSGMAPSSLSAAPMERAKHR